ncbi:MAG: GFA family protein [Sphingosinicella sp.]|uniref:GFA family protein n=1 Tax=Sphingosinicella sp. TaxID=1917971 RepID=UPI004037B2F8
MSELTGGCLCGNVRYAAGEPMVCGHCHCVDCRKTSATGHATHAMVPASAFEVSGELACYERPADSGNVVARRFCPTCGSAVFSTNSAMPGMIFLRASSLDDPDRVTPHMVVYASRAPAWDRIEGMTSFPEMAPLPA